jgi:hypothetical protein
VFVKTTRRSAARHQPTSSPLAECTCGGQPACASHPHACRHAHCTSASPILMSGEWRTVPPRVSTV